MATTTSTLRRSLLFSSRCPILLPSPLISATFSTGTSSSSHLAFEEVRSTEGQVRPFTSTALVLHGLLGSGRNWRSFARNLASLLARSSPSQEWRMILVDLRNHGKSTGRKGFDPPHDLKNAARDLANLVESQKWAWPDAVIGHSMGGKVALQYAQGCFSGEYGENAILPKQLWVLDSIPGVVNTDNSDGEVEKVLRTLENLPPSLPSRKWVIERMLQLGFSKSVSQWIGSNLNKSEDHVTWSFDLQAAITMFNSYRELNYWPLLENPPKVLEIAIVRAENSDRWSPHVVEKLEQLSLKAQGPEEGKVSLHNLPNAGHWVHVDNPKGLLEIMTPNFASESAKDSF